MRRGAEEFERVLTRSFEEAKTAGSELKAADALRGFSRTAAARELDAARESFEVTYMTRAHGKEELSDDVRNAHRKIIRTHEEIMDAAL